MFNRLPTSRRASLYNDMPRRKFAHTISAEPKKYEPFSLEQIGAYLARQIQDEFVIDLIDAGPSGKDLILIKGTSFTGSDVQIQIAFESDLCKIYCSVGDTVNRSEWKPTRLIDMWRPCGVRLYRLVSATLKGL